MIVKLESLNIYKEKERDYSNFLVEKIKGDINLKIYSDDKIAKYYSLEATQKFDINNLSNELQEDLIKLIKRIEKELNE